MTEAPATLPTLRDLRVAGGLSIRQLSDLSGISYSAIKCAEDPDGSYATRDNVAAALAAALDTEPSQIYWFRGTSHKGRPAGTGTPLTHPAQQATQVCPLHFMQLPTSGICDDCS